MRPTALILLDGEPERMRLVATWPIVGARVPPELEAEEIHDWLLGEWERISGVLADDIARAEPILFENEILGPDGFVDGDAENFVRAHIAAALRKVTPKRERA